MRGVVLTAVMCCVAAAAFADNKEDKPIPLTPNLRAAVEAEIRKELSDPEAATLNGLSSFGRGIDNRAVTVCGSVGGKNGGDDRGEDHFAVFLIADENIKSPTYRTIIHQFLRSAKSPETFYRGYPVCREN